MKTFGLAVRLADAEANNERMAEIRTLLRQKLNWRDKTPTVRFMAQATGEGKRYNFLYHATSRAVHFSVGELSRRGWGRPGQMRIGFDTFEPYRATFAISWGWRLYIDTSILVRDKMITSLRDTYVDSASNERLMELATRIGAVPPMQIITAEELDWPFEENTH
jgi:hypothetical protein